MSGAMPATGAASAASGPAAIRPAGAAGALSHREGGEHTDLFARLLQQVSDPPETDDPSAPAPTPLATDGTAPADSALSGALTFGDPLAGLPGFFVRAPMAQAPRPNGFAEPADPPLAPGATPASAAPSTPATITNPPGTTAHTGTELPPGMSATTGTEVLDADAAAALARPEPTPATPPGRPAAAATVASGKPANGAAGPQGLRWRTASTPGDTRGLDSATHSPATAGNAAALHTAARAASRSTVAMYERYGTTSGTERATADAPASAGSPAWTSALAAATASTADALHSPTGQAAEAGPDGTSADAPDTTAADLSGSETQTAAQAAEDEARQIGHWGTPTLRHASLRVGQAGEDAIDIRLSLAGQELQVDFRTDSAEVRASLQQHADESLASLLQRSGLQLGGVSVGAQGQGGSADPREAARARQTTRALGPAGPAAPAAAPLRQPGMAPLRADGSAPLDVFA